MPGSTPGYRNFAIDAVAGMVLGMDTAWDKQHFAEPFLGTVQRDQK